MKKVIFWSLLIVILVGVEIFVLGVDPARAQEQENVITNVEVSDITVSSVVISWNTTVETQGKVTLGSTETDVSDWNTNFTETLNLGINTSPATVEYTITVNDRAGKIYTYDGSFDQPATEIEVSAEVNWITNNSARIDYTVDGIDFLDKVSVEYGTTSGNYTDIAYPVVLPYTSGDILVDNLFANKTYYYRVAVRDAGPDYLTTYSEEQTFTTHNYTSSIVSVTPEEGSIGTTITIEGQGFGTDIGVVGMGTQYSRYCRLNTEIESWSDNKIIAKIVDSWDGPGLGECSPRTGSVNVFNSPATGGGTVGTYYTVMIDGPIFTLSNDIDESVISDNQPEEVVNKVVVSENNIDEADIVDDAFGCSFSTTEKNDAMVKVSDKLLQGSDTYNYLNDVYLAYWEAWSRYPRCDELQFHLDHSTPIESLKNWLSITNPNKPSDNIQPKSTNLKFITKDDSLVLEDKNQKMEFIAGDPLVISGVAVPNSIIKLTVNSETKEYFTTSDSEGYWTYAVTDKLDNGSHSTEIEVINKDGKTLGKSSKISFTIIPIASATTVNTSSETSTSSTSILIIVIVIVVILIVILLIFIKKKAKSVDTK